MKRGTESSRTTPDAVRLPRTLTRVSSVAAVLALGGWAYVVTTILQLADVPTALIRTVQVLTGIALLGLAAAVWRLVAEARGRTGRRQVVGAAVLVAAFAAVSWGANVLLLMTPDITF
jgi:hypothetical protein